MNELGHVRELVRYPVKSMAGVPAESAFLGWHGLAGDRRFAFRRIGNDSGFPWLNASRVAELLLYRPDGLDESSGEPLPTHVRTPDGRLEELRSLELQHEVSERFGSSVELMAIRSGILRRRARIGDHPRDCCRHRRRGGREPRHKAFTEPWLEPVRSGLATR